MRHLMTSTAVALALTVSAGAYAQTQTQPVPRATAPTSAAAMQQQAGEYMADDIIGTNVRNAQNENIGSVSDLVIDKNGQVKAAIVSVGGFLGIGDKRVAVPWNQLQVRADSAGAGAPRTGTTGTTGTAPAAASRDPVLTVNMTKDQLKAAPEFKTMAQQGRDTDRTRTAPSGAPAGAPPAGGTAPAPAK